MADDALELVRLRNNFYRDNYRRVVGALLLMVVINVALIGLVVYLVTHRPQPQYFATTTAGRIIPIQPLSEPVVTQAALLQWANEAAVAVNTYSFVNYRKQFQSASKYFTPDGWKHYLSQFKASGNLKTVLDKQLVVNAVATGAPVITQQGVLDGRYAWKVSMPLLITYQGGGTSIRQPVTVTMVVVRVPTVDKPHGIGIVQYFSSERPLTES